MAKLLCEIDLLLDWREFEYRSPVMRAKLV